MWVLVGIAGITLIKAKEIYPVTAWLRFTVQLGGLGICVFWLRRARSRAASLMFFWVLMLAGVAGTAMGPGTFFGERAMDPSVWGILNGMIPGYGGMRDLIRFAPLITVCGAALISVMAFSLTWRVRIPLGLGLLLMVMLEVPRFEAPRTRVNPGRIALQPEAERFFSSLDGAMLVVPAAPFHRNPIPMLRWQAFQNLRLVNGYTGRPTEMFTEVMRAENHHGRGSPEQVGAATASGADWICVQKAWVPQATEVSLSTAYPVVYEDGDFLVIRPDR